MQDRDNRSDHSGRQFAASVFRVIKRRADLRALGHATLNIIFPQRCFVCGDIIDDSGAICAECWGAFAFISAPMCFCCGYPFIHEVQIGTLCGACTKRLPPYAQARAALIYDEASRDLVLAFKHADRTRYADAFGHWLIRAGAEFLSDSDAIIPVPLHPWRLLQRRFNQSLLLARAVSRQTGCAVLPDVLVRRRNTRPQGRLSRAARLRNVQNAFAIRPGSKTSLIGKKLALIDDVFTTGATVESCARVLLAAGAREINVLTLARVVRPR